MSVEYNETLHNEFNKGRINMGNNLFSRGNKPQIEAEKEEEINRLMDRIEDLPEDEQKKVDRVIDWMLSRHDKHGQNNGERDIRQGRQAGFRDWLQKELTYRGLTLDALLATSGLDPDAIERINHCGESDWEIGYEECDALADGLGLPPNTVFKAAGLSTSARDYMRYARPPDLIEWIQIYLQADEVERYDLMNYIEYVKKRNRLSPEKEYKSATAEMNHLLSSLPPKQREEAIRDIKRLVEKQEEQKGTRKSDRFS